MAVSRRLDINLVDPIRRIIFYFDIIGARPKARLARSRPKVEVIPR